MILLSILNWSIYYSNGVVYMEDVFVVNGRAIPILSEEDIALGRSLLQNLNSSIASKEECEYVIQELRPLLSKLEVMISTFRLDYENISLIESDDFISHNLGRIISSIDTKSDRDVCIHYKEFFNDIGWILTPYSLSVERIFQLDRFENYKDYVLKDFELLVSTIRKDIKIEKFSDIYLSDYKFRNFIFSPKNHCDKVYNFTVKTFRNMLKTIDTCVDYSSLQSEYLGSVIYCLALWGSNDIVKSKYLNLYNLYKNVYYELIKNKAIVSPIKHIIR